MVIDVKIESTKKEEKQVGYLQLKIHFDLALPQKVCFVQGQTFQPKTWEPHTIHSSRQNFQGGVWREKYWFWSWVAFFYNNQANGNTVNFQHLLQYFGSTDAPDLDHCKFWCDPTGEENLEFATALNKTCEEKQQAILGRYVGHIGIHMG